MLYRMVLRNHDDEYTLSDSIVIRRYCPKSHHEVIRSVYGRSFAEPSWPSDWDKFDEFDAKGVFIAEDIRTPEVIGFILSFRRFDYRYISVVAVAPEYHQQGVGSALVKTAIRYLHGLNLQTIRIDAFVDATPAVNLYRKVGFQVEAIFEDKEKKY